MLNGIGGRTIAEAKERMSAAEYEAWRAYIRRHGSLNLGLRVEDAAALIAWTTQMAQGGKLEHDAFFPVRELDEQAELEKAMKSWR